MSLQNRGSATSSFLQELDHLKAASVLYQRLWCDGLEAQARVKNGFALGLGTYQGRNASESFGHLHASSNEKGSRPDTATLVASLATEVGLAFMRMRLSAPKALRPFLTKLQ